MTHRVDCTRHAGQADQMWEELCAERRQSESRRKAVRDFLAALDRLPSTLAAIKAVAGAEYDKLAREAERP